MKKEINTEILIHASAKEIWNVLMDFDRYPEWNPFIIRIEGHKELGGELKIVLQSAGESTMNFVPLVVENKQAEKFAWHGTLLFKQLFNGIHCFELIEVAEKKTLFKHSETFNGFLVRFLGKELKKTEQNFHLMNESLRQRVESEFPSS
ncbi:SRPBCC domain-containing protein [Acinetobacter sp. C26M]|uniref:SRPBCC domain-containing protein n=1 Tax=unclassified Acinetobacter TaxID=196816 RepID=UPI002036D77C|nr:MULTISPECIES: SRPBCC domain-containing protein [unclassified Acinetobacter]USA46217.1 SRPBCC domain-containing protein [Acinetobacter sp. C26M]USA49701.1 SRPBCC domain-containing protein [Acinetobacter sp. C26G]